jgi:predicted  nucleic acid-binding Zn-ribbon protein
MLPIKEYTFLYCDKCGWYTDTTEMGMKCQCHDCGNVALCYLSDKSYETILDRLYEIQVEIGCRLLRNVFMLNKDLAMFSDVDSIKYLSIEEIQMKFKKGAPK